MVEAVEDGFVGTELPRLDSTGEEGEEVEAELAVLFDPCGEGRDDGNELVTVAAMAELGSRERNERERGRWGKRGAGELANASWASWPRGHDVHGWGQRHGASAPCTVEKKRNFTKIPLAPLSVITKRSSSNFGNLNEALKHFYKIYKNL